MIVRPCSVASSPSGFLVGWVSELGPAWTRIATPRALTADASYLGEDASGLVAVGCDGDEPMAVYTQADGTFVQRGDEPVRCLALMAHVLDTCSGWTVACTREGVLAGRDELALVSSRTDVRRARVVPVPGGALVFCAGERDLGVIHVEGKRVDEVTHRLDAVVTGLDAVARGGRAAVVVGTDAHVMAAEVNGRGKMRGKLHAVLQATDRHPRIGWMVSEFVLVASAPVGVRVSRFEGGHVMTFEEVRGEYGFAFQQGRVLVVQVQTADEEDSLALWSRDMRGGMRDVHTIPSHPRGTELRRRRFAARRIFEQLGAALTATGYRERGRGEVEARALRARVRVGERLLQLDARLERDGVELAVDVGPADPAPPARSFARLARCFRGLTPTAREAREAMHARVAEVVGNDVVVVDAERSADLTSLTLHAREVPSAIELVRWLKALGEL